jgi:hypothetical protein
MIASLGGMPLAGGSGDAASVRAAAKRFPEQSTGFMMRDGRLYQIAVTPV